MTDTAKMINVIYKGMFVADLFSVVTKKETQ